MKQSNGPAGAKDVSALLYRAALGRDPQDRWLRRFQARDAGAARRLPWHWGAFLSALGWLALRGLFGVALLWACAAALGSVLALGLARLVFGADAQSLAAVLAGLAALSSVAWGVGAERLYHRVANRRILHAVATQESLAAACAQLQRRQPGRASRWAVLLALGAGVLVALAALRPALRPVVPAGVVVESVEAAPPAETPAEPAPEPTIAPAPPQAEPAAAEVAAAAPAVSAPPPPASAPPPAPTAPQPAPAVRKTPKADAAAGRYAVQVGVFADSANARAALAKLKAAGLAARVDVANAKGHQRVRAGPFATLAQAQAAGERIRALGLPAVVVPLRSPEG